MEYPLYVDVSLPTAAISVSLERILRECVTLEKRLWQPRSSIVCEKLLVVINLRNNFSSEKIVTSSFTLFQFGLWQALARCHYRIITTIFNFPAHPAVTVPAFLVFQRKTSSLVKHLKSFTRLASRSSKTTTSNGRRDGITFWNRCRTPISNGSV